MNCVVLYFYKYVRYGLYSEPNMVEDIKIRRLGWAGNIIRMEEERIPKKRF